MTPELERFAFDTNDGHHPLNRRLAQAGFAYPDWPAEHGGCGRTPYDLAALRGVLYGIRLAEGRRDGDPHGR